MWIRISNIPVKQLEATQLENPKHPGHPMTLSLFQQEGRTAFFVNIHKKVFAQYLETPSGKVIPRRKWTEAMKAFSNRELELLPPQKGGFRLTIFGWIFFLFAFGLLGYLLYDGLVTGPERTARFQQELMQKAEVSEGDIYFGRIEVYKEKGNPLGMKGAFGWFKIVDIKSGHYYLAESTEMSKSLRPKEQMNNTDFKQETIAVNPEELTAYNKTFISDDGLTQISLNEKKEGPGNSPD